MPSAVSYFLKVRLHQCFANFSPCFSRNDLVHSSVQVENIKVMEMVYTVACLPAGVKYSVITSIDVIVLPKILEDTSSSNVFG